MKIYPKIRKYQSGGQLSEVNFYPTVQYTPTTSVAITQGAWTPLKQTVTPDAVIDPELLKKIGGLTNENSAVMQKMNSDLHSFNSLNEAEKRSNQGINLLNSIKGNTALVTELANNKERNDKAKAKAESSDAWGVLAVDRNGNVAVTLPSGEIKYVPPAEYVSNLGVYKGKTAKELSTERENNPNELFGKGIVHDDVISQLTGTSVHLENLSKIAPTIGTDEINTKIQGAYGFDKNDFLVKSFTIGNGTLTNDRQIAAASDLAFQKMPTEDVNSIKAIALQKLVSNSNVGDYFALRQWNPKTRKVETHKQSYNDIKSTLSTLNQQENAEKDPDKIQEIRNKKAGLINRFQQEYVKSFIQDYFDAKRVNKQDYSSTFDVADKDMYENVGSGAFKKTDATFDAKAVGDQFVVMGEAEAVIPSKNSLTATVHTKPYTGLFDGDGTGLATNIDKDPKYGKVFINTADKDAKFKYMVENTETLDGRDLTSYSRDVKNNMYRVGAGDATKGFFKTDQNGKVFAITPKTVNPVTGNKIIDDISDKMIYYKLKIKADTSGKYTREKANEEFNAWAKSQNLLHVPEIVYKTVALVPVNTTNRFDRQLIQGGSNYSSLSKDEKETLQNTLNKAASAGVGSSAIDDAILGVKVRGDDRQATVNIGGNNYVVVVREVAGISQDLAKVQNVSEAIGQKATFTHAGDINLLDAGHIDLIKNLIGTSSDIRYDNRIEEKEQGGIIPQFVPQEFKIKPLSLKDLY